MSMKMKLSVVVVSMAYSGYHRSIKRERRDNQFDTEIRICSFLFIRD